MKDRLLRTGEQAGTYGNRILLMSVPFHTDIEDPIARLRTTHDSLADMKERHKALPAELLQDAVRAGNDLTRSTTYKTLVEATQVAGADPW